MQSRRAPAFFVLVFLAIPFLPASAESEEPASSEHRARPCLNEAPRSQSDALKSRLLAAKRALAELDRVNAS